MQDLSNLFETFMLLSLGVSWPVSTLVSIKARTAKGKSVIYLSLVLVGYLFGITYKFMSQPVEYVAYLYVLNALLVAVDISVYFRNRRLDIARDNAHRDAYFRNKQLED